MKFKQYINESRYIQKEIDDFNTLIHDHCKPYLKLIKGKDPLCRGMNPSNIKWGDSNIGLKNVRTDRKPLGTSTKIFKKVNKWLDENNHNKRNNTVICTSDEKWAKGFSPLYYIFPTGNISYTWMNAKDFNVDDKRTGWYRQAPTFFLAPETLNFVSMFKGPDNFKKFESYFHTDKGFDIAYKNGYEFWIKCKSYYYIYFDNLDIVWDHKYQVFV